MSEELTNRLARHLRILEAARRHDDGTMRVWPEDVDVVAEAVTALSNPAAADSNASAEAITDDQIEYAHELAEDRRREWANASAEARLREALEPFAVLGRGLYEANQRSDQSVLIGASAEFLNLRPLIGQHFVNAHLALSPDPHASDCEKQGETTKSEGGGQVAPAKCSATGVHPTDTSCAAEPEVAPGPSARPADVTEEQLAECIYNAIPATTVSSGRKIPWQELTILTGYPYPTIVDAHRKEARALLDAFTVGRR